MAIQANGYELMGVSVSGGPLQETVHLELNEGLSALYGVNGAGKTWLLRLVSSALTGVALEVPNAQRQPTADLHVRFYDAEDPTPSPFLQGVVDRLEASVRARRGNYLQTDPDDDALAAYREELGERQVNGNLWALVAMLIDLAPITHGAPQAQGEPMYEGAYGGLLTLRASGTTQRPAWDAHLAQSVSTGDEFPSLLRSASQAWLEMCSITDPSHAGAPGGMDDFKAFLKSWHQFNPLYWSEAALYLQPRARNEPSRQAAHSTWPGWLQVPVLPLADAVHVAPLQVLGSDEKPRDVDGETLAYLLASRLTQKADGGGTVTAPAVLGNGSTGPLFSPGVATALGEVQRAAQANLEDVLVSPPQLRFDMASVEEWLEGRRPAWQYLEKSSGEWLPISALSSAQARWARLAVGLAPTPRGGLPVVFMCDEPEAGLHRLAERHLATGLHRLSIRTGVNVMAATHSPRLLDANHMRPVLVHRAPHGAVAISPVSLSLVDRSSAERTAEHHGLTVGDLTALMGLSVVVEGVHDEFVFAALLRDALDGALADILPMHGGRYARSMADARLLFEGTDAPVLVVLDNLQHDQVHAVWTQTTALAKEGRLDDARACLEGLDRQKSSERLFLHQLGVRALEVGRMDRIHVHGLSQPDVICYLPTGLLLQKPGEWPDLIRRWKKDAAPKQAENLKKWLVANHYLPSDRSELDRRIEHAAFQARRAGAPVHPDLVGLGLDIQSLGASAR